MPLSFTYDLTLSWEENYQRGPRFSEPPLPIANAPLKKFLGFQVCTRIGIAAGILPNRLWVLPYAQRGFGILTYKTVRSTARLSYPLPNWVFVENTPDGPVTRLEAPPEKPDQISSAVCFGMPSPPPEIWREDVRQTTRDLPQGHILIVSVVGTPGPDPSLEALADDFATCAAWAKEAGAHVIEANLSCPNVCSAEGTLYQDSTRSRAVAHRIRQAIGSTPLLLKVGTWDRVGAMREFLQAVSGFADGVTLVNCMNRPVINSQGHPVFGKDYPTAGVIGRTIHSPCVQAVQEARNCIDSDGLGLTLAAVGGVSTVTDIARFFDSGADAVLCGSSPVYLPSLATDARNLRADW